MPIPPLSPTTTAAMGRNPADDARQFVELISSGKTDEAARHFARLMGSDDPAAVPPVSLTDPNSYESALLAQVGAQLGLRNFALTSFPRLMENVKIR